MEVSHVVSVDRTRATVAFSAAEAFLKFAEPRFTRGEALNDGKAGARTQR
jgi:hypothetical protein